MHSYTLWEIVVERNFVNDKKPLLALSGQSLLALFNPYLCEDVCNLPNSRSVSFPKDDVLLDVNLQKL